jgi:hypothetical protein
MGSMTTDKMVGRVIAAYYILVAVLCVYWMVKALNAINATPRLPCVVSEISPEFSFTDKEKCRLLRNHKL